MKRFVFASALLACLATSVSAQVFTNSGTINILDAASANPYPSTINVAAGPAAITSISVTLRNLTHTYIGDIDILLVGPGGQTVALMSDVGDGVNFVGENMIFTSAAGAPSAAQTPVSAGTYAPTNLQGADAYGAPAPAGPHGADFSGFIGTNANGVWSLYIRDDFGSDAGTISGWSITFNQATPVEETSNLLTYQGKLTSGAVPVNGNVDLQFSFWRNSFSTDAASRVLLTPVQFNIPVADGLFTTKINPGGAFFDNKELWLEIAVRNPAGVGGFSTLTGRQRVTPAPSATWASSAGSADTATRADSATSALTADMLVSPDNTPVVRTANNGVVGIARPATTIGNGTFIVEGVQGTSANVYGGMHVNTPDAGAWPFVGLATANNFRAWMYYNPAITSMIFNNGGDQMWVKTNGVTVGTATLTAGNRMEVAGAIRATAFNVASSQRYKTNIHDLGPVLDRFAALRPVSYDWNQTVDESLRGRHTLGLIAEDVHALFPDAVTLDEEGKPASIDYSRIAALSVQAIKDLRSQNAAREAELAELKARMAALEKALNK